MGKIKKDKDLNKGSGGSVAGNLLSKMGLRTLRSKITAVFLVIAIIPLLVLSYLSIDKSREVLERDSIKFSEDISQQVTNTIDGMIGGVASQLVTLSTSSGLEGIDGTYLELLETTKQSNPDYIAVYLAKPDKSMTLNRSSDEPLPDDYDPTSREWYTEAVSKKGSIYVSDPYADASSGDLVITLSRAVMSGDSVVGVVGIDLNIDRMVGKIEGISIGENGFVYVVSGDGNIVLHPDKDLIGSSITSNKVLWDVLKESEQGTVHEDDHISSFSKSKFSGWEVVTVLPNVELDKSGDEVSELSLIVIGIVVLVIVIVSFLLGRSISANINELLRVMNKTAEGDLTDRTNVPSRDEFKIIGDSFNSTLDTLTEVLSKVEESSIKVSETSLTLSNVSEETRQSVNQVTDAVGEVAEGTMEQTQSVSTGVEEMKGLSDRLVEITKSTELMVSVSDSSSKLSKSGLEKVEVLNDRSDQTRSATDKVSEIVSEVSKSMDEIDVILSAISGITEQTNLLALNAAIEAARAGEAGRGFAVVASEVRKLAEQSKDSTVEIGNIISGIKGVVKTAVDSMEDVKESVVAQDVAVHETREIFTELLSSLTDMENRVNEVKSSVSLIDQNRESVVREMSNISSVSSHNAAASEEVYASTEEITARMSEFAEYATDLAELANGLKDEVLKFKVK